MYDLEEQEKIDALKGWWKENRNQVVMAALAGLVLYAGITGWKSWKASQADQAANQFLTFQQASTAAQGDPLKIQAAARTLETASPHSPFASRAALMAAVALANADKKAEAQVELQWVVDHASEAELVSLARIRLAGLLADQQKYDPALALLATGVDAGFATLAGDRRGDILLAQGKVVEARAAYRSALETAEGSSPLKAGLQTKVDALGGDTPAPKAAAAEGSK